MCLYTIPLIIFWNHSTNLFAKNFCLYNLCNNFQFRLFFHQWNFCSRSHSMMFLFIRQWNEGGWHWDDDTATVWRCTNRSHRYLLETAHTTKLTAHVVACRSDRSRRKLKHCTKSIKQINYTEKPIAILNWLHEMKLQIFHSIRPFIEWRTDWFHTAVPFKMPLIYADSFVVHICFR